MPFPRFSLRRAATLALASIALSGFLRGDEAGVAPPAIEEIRPELFYLKTGTGGLVPVPGFRYEDFVEMLRLKDGLPRGPKPPSAVITSVTFDGTIEAAVCRAVVELRVTQAEAGRVGLPIGLSSMRFTGPPVHEGPGRFVIEVDEETRKGDRQPGFRGWFDGPMNAEHVVRLEGTVSVERSAVQESLAIDLPSATASRAIVVTQLAEPVVTVVPAAGDAKVEPNESPAGGSRIEIVGIAGDTRIRLASSEAAVQVEGAAPQAVGEVVVRIDGRRAVSDVMLSLANLPPDTRTVRVRLPKLATVTRVEPPAAVVETGGTATDPEVLFNVERSPSGESVVRFECETPVDASGGTPLEALAYRVDGIPDWRQWGRVSVVVSGDWQIAWGPTTGNRRVDPPKAIESDGCVGAFAFDAQPARLPIRVTPLGSRVVIEPEYRYVVSGGRIELDARLRVSVRGAPVGGIELGLDGWSIDDVGPANLVDTAGLTGAAGRLTIPFLKPLSGNATVELRAARGIPRGDERVAWTMPAPKADLVAPAAVEIVPDRDIELVPDTTRIKGLVRQVSPSTSFRDPEFPAPLGRDATTFNRDKATLAYRLDAAAGSFEATRRFLPRRVGVSATARAVVDRSDIVVEETLRFEVAHVPLEEVSLAVPRVVVDSGALEVRQNDQLLTPLEESSDEPPLEEGTSGEHATPNVVVRFPLAYPLLGAGELKLRYSLKTPEIPDEASVPEDLPLVLPSDGRLARQSFTVDSQPGIAIDVRGDQWKRDTAGPVASSSRSWSSGKPQASVPLALSTERQTSSASSVVEAAWLETRLLPDRREDLFRYRIETAAPSIAVTLPPSSSAAGASAGSLAVRVDGHGVAGEMLPGGRLVVDLSGGGTAGVHLLEIEREQPREGLFEPLVLEPPQFGERTVQRRFYWELRLESNDHVIIPPAQWTSQQEWAWSAVGLERRSVVARRTLARWLAGNGAGNGADLQSQAGPPVAERRAVYSGVGWPGRDRVWLAPTWLVVLAVSGPILLAGLAAIYRPAARSVPAMIAAAIVGVAIALAAPDQFPLFAQAAVPGVVLAVLAAALERAVGSRGSRPQEVRTDSVVIPDGSTRTIGPVSVLVGPAHRSETGSVARLVLLAAVAAAATATADEPQKADREHDKPPLRFLRLHVPRDGVTADLLGEGRYVPMAVGEFDAAVLAAGHPDAPPAVPGRAARAIYRLEWSPGAALEGSLEVDVDESSGRLPLAMRLFGPDFAGRCRVDRPVVESRMGTGAAMLIGLADGGTAFVARDRGVHRCGWRLEPSTPSTPDDEPKGGGRRSERFVVPLVPSLATTMHLVCPTGFRPVFNGAWARAGDEHPDSGRSFVVDLGPREQVAVALVPTTASPTPIAIANDVSVSKRIFNVAAEVVPRRPWESRTLFVELDPGLAVTDVALADDDEAAVSWSPSTGRTVQVILPDRCSGRLATVVVHAIAAVDRPDGTLVPVVRPLRDAWTGGTVTVTLDQTTTFASIAAEGGLLVDPGPVRDRGVPVIVMEQQRPRADLRVAIAPRPPEMDVARVTTVDLVGGAVSARTAANVVVRRGEAFEIEAMVTPGWIIDAVEFVGERRPPEWRVDATEAGSILTIGLVNGIGAGPGLDLRIAGHRPPLPKERGFSSADIDMLRFRGESEGLAVMDLRANAETTLLVDGVAETASTEVPERLKRLSEAGQPRARIAAGGFSPPREITILRRRPPVDVRTRIRLSSRDDRLAESFTFECVPRTAELDSMLVHFSAPTDGQLEWTVLAPGNARVAARRAESGGEEGEDRSDAAAESWLVDIIPPVREAITLRASRSGPFRGPRAACLAWVEGSPVRTGEVVVRDAGRSRPTITGCRLPEIAVPAAASDRSSTPVASFGFDVDRDLSPGGRAVFELEPGVEDPAAARAWAWSETTTAWCYESGAVEYQTRFQIENHGRRTVTLEVPADKRLELVHIDDVRLELAGADSGGSQVPIELPAGRRFVRIDVRLHADRGKNPGLWNVDGGGGRLDVPVMGRSWNVALPPGLELAFGPSSHRLVSARPRTWSQRLWGGILEPEPPRAAAEDPFDPASEGFRKLSFMPRDGGGPVGRVTLVRRSLLERLAILAGVSGAAVGLWLARRRPVAVVSMIAALASFVLWAAGPWEFVARTALWGVVSTAVASRAVAVLPALAPRRNGSGSFAAPSAVAIAVVTAVAAIDGLADEPPLPTARVLVTPGDAGDIALVPESLFRALSAAAAGRKAASSTGMVEARVVARRPQVKKDASPVPWTVELDCEAGDGETVVLEQGSLGGRFVPGSVMLDGRAVPDAIGEGGRVARIPLPAAGGHRIRIDVVPRVAERGDLGEAAIDIPTAIRSRLSVEASASSVDSERRPSGVECEWSSARSAAGSGWNFSKRLEDQQSDGGAFDVSGAGAVRIVWPLSASASVRRQPAAVLCRNDVEWGGDVEWNGGVGRDESDAEESRRRSACVVAARLDVEAAPRDAFGDSIVPAIVVEVDPRLEPPDEAAAAAAGVAIEPLGDGTSRIRWRSPSAGRQSVTLSFRMPLDRPVGVFDVPLVRPVRGTPGRVEVRLRTAPGLRVRADMPESATAIQAGPQDVAGRFVGWSAEGPSERVLVAVSRREVPPDVAQDLAVGFQPDHVALSLRVRIESHEAAVPEMVVAVPKGAVVERASLFASESSGGASEPREPLDARLIVSKEGRVAIVPQAPRVGRLQLELDARLPGRPAPRGTLPIARLVEPSASLNVTWKCSEDSDVAVEVAGEEEQGQSVIIESDGAIPRYRVGPRQVAGSGDGPVAEAPPLPRPAVATAEGDAAVAGPGAPRVELAHVRLAVDERGRAWGVVRFELLSSSPAIRIRLPDGMRLFEAFIDDHSVPAVPADGDHWEVVLLDASRPRAIVVVFAGDLGDRVAAGAAFEIDAPSIESLPTRELVWTIRGPRDRVVRLMPGAREIPPDEVASLERAAIDRLMPDVIHGFRTRNPEEQANIRTFLERGFARDDATPEATWNRSSLDLAAEVCVVCDAGDSAIGFRVARPVDATLPGRILGTLAMALAAAIAWKLSRGPAAASAAGEPGRASGQGSTNQG